MSYEWKIEKATVIPKLHWEPVTCHCCGFKAIVRTGEIFNCPHCCTRIK